MEGGEGSIARLCMWRRPAPEGGEGQLVAAQAAALCSWGLSQMASQQGLDSPIVHCGPSHSGNDPPQEVRRNCTFTGGDVACAGGQGRLARAGGGLGGLPPWSGLRGREGSGVDKAEQAFAIVVLEGPGAE